MTADVLAFLEGDPGRVTLFEAVEKAIAALGPSEYRVSKSQIAWKNPLNFAFVSLPQRWYPRWSESALLLTFGLGRRVEGDEIFRAVEPYPGRWTHHVILNRPEDLDGAVRAWLAEAYDFSQAKRRKKKGTSRPLPPSKEGD